MAQIPVTNLPASESGTVVRVEGPIAEYLSGYGIYPGVRVEVRQRFPSFVLKSEETEVALEKDVARRIVVEYPGHEGDH